MKKCKLVSFIFILLFILEIKAQSFSWAKSVGGTGIIFSSSIIIDSEGNIYNTGHFYGTIDFDPGVGIFNLSSEGGGSDIYVYKLNALGIFQWAKSIGGPSEDFSSSIKVDLLGNLYITGDFRKNVDFDPGAGILYLTSKAFSRDVFILKLDSFGNFLWAKSFGGVDEDASSAISLDDYFNVYLVGRFNGLVDFDPGKGVNELYCSGFYNGFIVKLDLLGSFKWAKTICSQDYAMIESIAVDRFEHIYITGHFRGINHFNIKNDSLELNTNGDSDIFISKLDTLGQFEWVKVIGGNEFEEAHSILCDNSGYIYVNGTFNGTLDFDPDTGIYNLKSKSTFNNFVAKFDNTGQLIWAIDINTGRSFLTLDDLGNTYCFGTFEGTVDFNPGVDTFEISSIGPYDFYISKTDNLGQFLWVKSIELLNGGLPSSITLDHDLNIITTGNFKGTCDLNPDWGIEKHTSIGVSDQFVLKIDQRTVNMNSINNKIDFDIFPNPSSQFIRISLNNNNTYDIWKINVFNSSGQLVYCISNHSNHSIVLNKETIGTGLFYIQIHANGEMMSKKIFFE